jgi:predicted O-methyltransferase YrrM
MTLETTAPVRNVQPHATSGQRSTFDKLRSFSGLNPRLAPRLARTMLKKRDASTAQAFAAYVEANGFEFTYDCVSNNIPFIQPLLLKFAAAHGNTPIRYLEIGAYEGRNITFMDWLLPKRLDITAIDPWFDETHNPDEIYHGIEARFRRNAARVGSPVTVLKSFSSIELPKMQAAGERFDMMYVDGSHTAVDVMIDMCFCANLLRVGGMMILDDYWHDVSDIGGPGVKQAVDRFLGVFRGHFNVVAAYRQVVLIKTAELPR